MLQTLIGDFHECSAVTSVSLPAFQKVVERRLYIVEILGELIPSGPDYRRGPAAAQRDIEACWRSMYERILTPWKCLGIGTEGNRSFHPNSRKGWPFQKNHLSSALRRRTARSRSMSGLTPGVGLATDGGFGGASGCGGELLRPPSSLSD
jgi:hypothetical protein